MRVAANCNVGLVARRRLPWTGLHKIIFFRYIMFIMFSTKEGKHFSNVTETSFYIALQDMQTFKKQAKIMLPFLVTLLLTKVSNCA